MKSRQIIKRNNFSVRFEKFGGENCYYAYSKNIFIDGYERVSKGTMMVGDYLFSFKNPQGENCFIKVNGYAGSNIAPHNLVLRLKSK